MSNEKGSKEVIHTSAREITTTESSKRRTSSAHPEAPSLTLHENHVGVLTLQTCQYTGEPNYKNTPLDLLWRIPDPRNKSGTIVISTATFCPPEGERYRHMRKTQEYRNYLQLRQLATLIYKEQQGNAKACDAVSLNEIWNRKKAIRFVDYDLDLRFQYLLPVDRSSNRATDAVLKPESYKQLDQTIASIKVAMANREIARQQLRAQYNMTAQERRAQEEASRKALRGQRREQ